MFSVFSICLSADYSHINFLGFLGHGGKVKQQDCTQQERISNFVPALLFQFCLLAPEIFERVAISPLLEVGGGPSQMRRERRTVV